MQSVFTLSTGPPDNTHLYRPENEKLLSQLKSEAHI